MSLPKLSLDTVSMFAGLDRAALNELEARLNAVTVPRGTALVTEGAKANALYVVVSGRFAVEVAGEKVAEISHGTTIGEIAFFAGGARTATVRAIRDSVVVRLTRDDFDATLKAAPEIWQSITATLATRLAAETQRAAAFRTGAGFGAAHSKAAPSPRTIAIVRAGERPIPEAFLSKLIAQAESKAGTRVLASANAGIRLDGSEATEALNALETANDRLIFIADDTLTRWSEKAINQADEVLLIGAPLSEPLAAPVALNSVEAYALKLLPASAIRLALVHARKGVVQGTRHWLAARNPAMHHHVAIDDELSLARLWRFLRGQAIGFVACGGGAFTAAHIGIYKALVERGIDIDIYGGTSGGSAMAAAFAEERDPADIDRAVHRMFIDGRAMQRYTLPRYGLIDHVHFDSHLEALYGSGRIEDMWKPYFAISADLSRYEIEVHRSGLIWQAVRASAAIPGFLPPFYTPDGRMLVDGSVIANVPIETMRGLKNGPNIVIAFRSPDDEAFTVDYAELPARRDLIWRTLNPLLARGLPNAPSAATVLIRSMMANRGHYERHLESDDWLMVPPTPPDMGALDWRQHATLAESGYRYARAEIDARGGSWPN